MSVLDELARQVPFFAMTMILVMREIQHHREVWWLTRSECRTVPPATPPQPSSPPQKPDEQPPECELWPRSDEDEWKIARRLRSKTGI